MTELAKIRDEMLEFVVNAEALENENDQLRNSIKVAKRKFPGAGDSSWADCSRGYQKKLCTRIILFGGINGGP